MMSRLFWVGLCSALLMLVGYFTSGFVKALAQGLAIGACFALGCYVHNPAFNTPLKALKVFAGASLLSCSATTLVYLLIQQFLVK